MKPRRALFGLMAVVLMSAICRIAAQESPAASLSGIVLDAATGLPVEGVIVTRAGPPAPPLPPAELLPDGTPLPIPIPKENLNPRPPRSQMQTGTDGRFVLNNLDSGRITISFYRAGYDFRSVPFSLSPGEEFKDTIVRLLPFGVLSGRLIDPKGNSAVNVQVAPFQERLANGSSGITYLPGTRTNDRGEFRLINLSSGLYWLSFSSSTLPDLTSDTPSMLETPAANAPGPLLYPGVREIARAESVEVKPGEETRLRDVVQSSTGPGAIRIRIVNPPGEPAKELDFRFTNESPIRGLPDSSGSFSVARSMSLTVNNAGTPGGTNLDGSLRFPRLRLDPGGTLLRVYWVTAPAVYGAVVTWRDAGGSQQSVTTRIPFTGADTSVEITAGKPNGRLSGRVVMEGNDGAAVPLAGVTVRFRGGAEIGAGSPLRISTADGTFSIADMVPGRYELSGMLLPPGSYVANVKQGERDVLTDGVQVSAQSPEIEFRLRQGAGSLAGKVTNGKGAPVPHAAIVLVPDPPLNRPSLTFLSPSVVSDQKGSFESSGLRPGSYRVYSWSNRDRISIFDPAFSRDYQSRGIPVRIEAEQRIVVDVRALDQN